MFCDLAHSNLMLLVFGSGKCISLLVFTMSINLVLAVSCEFQQRKLLGGFQISVLVGIWFIFHVHEL